MTRGLLQFLNPSVTKWAAPRLARDNAALGAVGDLYQIVVQSRIDQKSTQRADTISGDIEASSVLAEGD